MPVEGSMMVPDQRWQKDQNKKKAKSHVRKVLLLGLAVLLTTVGGCAGGGGDQADGAAGSDTAATVGQTTEQAQKLPGETTAGGESTPAGAETTGVAAETGTITGVVTDEETGEPLPNTYVTVGWETFQYAAITDVDGRYTVPNVPAGVPAPTFGFHDDGYRYHNSVFDDNLNIELEPGETYTYDFSLRTLPPEGQPEVSEPSIAPDTAAPGDTVTFGLTASDGAGGLSPEVFAANPEIGRLVLLKPADGENEYSAEFTIPPDTPPGEYTFAFFTASNECYVNGQFPTLTLTVTR